MVCPGIKGLRQFVVFPSDASRFEFSVHVETSSETGKSCFGSTGFNNIPKLIPFQHSELRRMRLSAENVDPQKRFRSEEN